LQALRIYYSAEDLIMSTTVLPDVDIRNTYAASLRRAARSFTAPAPPESMAASKARAEAAMDAVERLHPELFASQTIRLLW